MTVVIFYYYINITIMQEVEFLQYLVENIVENTVDIKIESKDDELGTLLTLEVNKDDMGIIIGKKGSTVNALRSILRLQGMKIGKKITLKVLEQD
ncbi:KH domain-containing protein [Candidatus Gracilibacteria bacterium]|nr:KH domain-containing protein [Candidatus Gracilibacteria bacterium]